MLLSDQLTPDIVGEFGDCLAWCASYCLDWDAALFADVEIDMLQCWFLALLSCELRGLLPKADSAARQRFAGKEPLGKRSELGALGNMVRSKNCLDLLRC